MPAADGAHVCDDTGAFGAHYRQHGTDDIELAEDIGIELRLDLAAAAFLNSTGQDVASVVDEDIDAARLLDNLVDPARELLVAIEHVKLLRDGTALSKLGELGRITCSRNNLITVGERSKCDLLAEAGGASRDEPDFAHGCSGVCSGT